MRWDPRLRRRTKRFAIFTGKCLCWSLFLINESVFNKHRCFPVNIAKFFRVVFSFGLKEFAKKVITLNYRQQCSRVSTLTSIKPSIIVYFRSARRENLFTQVKEPGARLTITFYQLWFECENIIFDVMC